MLLSVCIVNWNTRDFLRDCLSALYAHPPQDSSLEVIVVDNASIDGSAAMVQADFPAVTLIASPKNLGYAQGSNEALRRAGGDWVLLLNPDAIVHPDALTNVLRFAQAHPDAGAVGGRLIGLDGHTQSSLRSFPDPGPVLWEALGLSRVFPRSPVFGAYRMTYFDYDQAAPVDQPMGSFLLLSRRALEKVGMMDPQFPIFFNEVDWCWRAKRKHGYAIYYTPDAAATHYGGGSTRQVKPRMIQESHRSLLRFYHKHYAGHIAFPLYWLITQAVLWNERRLIRAAKKQR